MPVPTAAGVTRDTALGSSKLQRQQLLVSDTGQGLWPWRGTSARRSSGSGNGGSSKALTALGTHKENKDVLATLEHDREDTESTTPPRAAAGPAPRGSTPVPGITFCLAPDPTAPTTAPQSLRGPSGPSAVTEMQNKSCGFKTIIKKDLQCPEEHLQAGR